MWLYSTVYYTDVTTIGYLPQDILQVIRQQFPTTDNKCIQAPIIGATGGLGFIRIWINNQGTNVAGQIDFKTQTQYHNYGFFEIFF